VRSDSTRYQQLELEGLKLHPQQRRQLMLQLFMSLEPTMILPLDEELVDEMLIKEVQARLEDVRTGQTRVFSREEVMQRLEAQREEIGQQRREIDSADVTALDAAWNRAYRQKDTAALESILADDWTGYTSDAQQISKSMLLEAVRTNPEAILEFDAFKLHLFGQTAITQGRLTATMGDQVHQQRFMRVYQKRHQGWCAIAVQVIPIQTTGVQS
jgi:ketosteroid isomerase-like protein